MLNFLANNLPTILVGAAIVALIVFVAVKMFRDKKKGKSSCGCNCTNCPSAEICHTK